MEFTSPALDPTYYHDPDPRVLHMYHRGEVVHQGVRVRRSGGPGCDSGVRDSLQVSGRQELLVSLCKHAHLTPYIHFMEPISHDNNGKPSTTSVEFIGSDYNGPIKGHPAVSLPV